jgi:hypothetical protein
MQSKDGKFIINRLECSYNMLICSNEYMQMVSSRDVVCSVTEEQICRIAEYCKGIEFELKQVRDKLAIYKD